MYTQIWVHWPGKSMKQRRVHSLIKDVRVNRRPAKAYRAKHTFTEKHEGPTQTLLSLFTLKISQMLKAGAGQRMEHCVSFSHHSLQRIYELNTSCLSYILWLPFRQQWVAFLLASCGQCPIRCRTHAGHWDVLVNIWIFVRLGRMNRPTPFFIFHGNVRSIKFRCGWSLVILVFSLLLRCQCFNECISLSVSFVD